MSQDDNNSQDDYIEWQRQDELWQQRLAAGEDPGPRTPPPAPPMPEPGADQSGAEEVEAEATGWKWLRRGSEAAWCASCGCGLLSGCDTSLLTVAMVALGSFRQPRSRAHPRPTGSVEMFGAEFVDDDTLPDSRRRALALLRGYKRHVSAYTPNVCTQPVSCSAYAASTVRDVGTRRAVPLIARRLRLCAATARQRNRV